MRILFFHRWVGVHEGGTETHIKNLMSFLAGRGHAVALLTRQGEALTGFDRRVKIYYVPRVLGESNFSYKSMSDPRLYFYTALFMVISLLKLMILYARGVKFNLISTHFVTEAKVARLFRSLTKAPYVFVLEGYTDWEASEARYADLAFCSSAHEVEECLRHYGYKPVLKPHGVDMTVFRPNLPAQGLPVKDLKEQYNLGGRQIVLTVCRLEPRKDLPTLLAAVQIVVKENERVRFVIVGEGVQKEELEKMREALGLSKFIIFAGRILDQDLPNYYALGDVFVLPTLYEGFGIVYLEAMACGLPIISTRVGAVPEVVGDCGVLIEPRRPDLLAREILALLADANRRRALSQCGLAKIREKFDQKELLEIYERSCLKMLAGRRETQ